MRRRLIHRLINCWCGNPPAAFSRTMKLLITTFIWMIHLFDVGGQRSPCCISRRAERAFFSLSAFASFCNAQLNHSKELCSVWSSLPQTGCRGSKQQASREQQPNSQAFVSADFRKTPGSTITRKQHLTCRILHIFANLNWKDDLIRTVVPGQPWFSRGVALICCTQAQTPHNSCAQRGCVLPDAAAPVWGDSEGPVATAPAVISRSGREWPWLQMTLSVSPRWSASRHNDHLLPDWLWTSDVRHSQTTIKLLLSNDHGWHQRGGLGPTGA